MKRMLWIAAVLLTACQDQTTAQGGASDLVAQAVEAQGGAEALRALNGLELKGEARFWEPGQSQAAGGEVRELGTATVEVTWDLEKGLARTVWDRDQHYPPPAVKLTSSGIGISNTLCRSRMATSDSMCAG